MSPECHKGSEPYLGHENIDGKNMQRRSESGCVTNKKLLCSYDSPGEHVCTARSEVMPERKRFPSFSSMRESEPIPTASLALRQDAILAVRTWTGEVYLVVGAGKENERWP